jgi:hypothetical protein
VLAGGRLGSMARFLARAVPALAVGGRGSMARFLARAVPALAVGGLGWPGPQEGV